MKPPVIYVQRKQIDDLEDLEKAFPKHETIDEEKKSSITFVFENLDDRDIARDVLNERQIRYRTGKHWFLSVFQEILNGEFQYRKKIILKTLPSGYGLNRYGHLYHF